MRLIFAVLLLSLSFVAGCGRGESKGGEDASNSGKQSNKPAASQADSQPGVTIGGTAQERAGIRVAEVELRSIPQYLNASGQIVVDEERTAHVGTYTDGRVLEVHAEVGDSVSKGAVLARMHSHEVHETRAAYESALAAVERNRIAVAFRTRQRDRMLRLLELKSTSPQEVETAENDLSSAETDLANAQISVHKEAAHLTDILHLPESALSAINETTEEVPVIAPVSGIVVDRKLTPGAVVQPGEEVFTLSDLSRVWMLAAINETDMAKLHIGNDARIATDAFPDEQFNGRVYRLIPELDPQTRTLRARIAIPNPQFKLRPAMYASAQIDEGVSRQSIFVPEEAVQDINGASVVFLRKPNNRFEPKAIQIANRVNGEAEVRTGLRAGDAVVVKGSFVVKSEMLKAQIGE